MESSPMVTTTVSSSARARIARLWSILNEREGLQWRGQLVALAIAALTLLLRAPSFFLHPNFYAEDGRFWFQQAYNLGWLHSLCYSR